jgi:hypothetical protein
MKRVEMLENMVLSGEERSDLERLLTGLSDVRHSIDLPVRLDLESDLLPGLRRIAIIKQTVRGGLRLL